MFSVCYKTEELKFDTQNEAVLCFANLVVKISQDDTVSTVYLYDEDGDVVIEYTGPEEITLLAILQNPVTKTVLVYTLKAYRRSHALSLLEKTEFAQWYLLHLLPLNELPSITQIKE